MLLLKDALHVEIAHVFAAGKKGAKVFKDSTKQVFDILESKDEVYAMIAPSFIAEFFEMADHRSLVFLLRKLGFSKVFEVAFGATWLRPNTENL